MPNSKNVVLVTGASRGLGNACANLLAENNYTVYGASRNSISTLNQNSADLFHTIKMDITDSESVLAGVNQITEDQGQIDILINNAGIVTAGPIEQTSMDEAKNQLETNFFGTVQVCKTVLPYMRKQRSGLIINISSTAGLIGLPFQGFYSASKFAIEGYSEALSKEVRSLGINVVIIAPGDYNTNQLANRIIVNHAEKEPDYKDRFKSTRDVIYADETSGKDPKHLAKKILKIIRSKKPKLHYMIGPHSLLPVFIKRLIPGRWFEKIMIDHYKA